MRVKENLLRIFKGKEFNTALAAVGTGTSVSHPLAGAIIQLFQQFTSVVDEVKINNVLRGLATGIDQERLINQLYNYVSESDENAYYVANTLRKALLSDSPIICCVLGRILSDHVDKNLKYDHSDMVIIHALENATDADLRLFKSLMSSEVFRLSPKDQIEYLYKEISNNPSVQDCIDWCVYNRILKSTTADVVGEELIWGPSYACTETAERLYKYINSVWQVFSYGL